MKKKLAAAVLSLGIIFGSAGAANASSTDRFWQIATPAQHSYCGLGTDHRLAYSLTYEGWEWINYNNKTVLAHDVFVNYYIPWRKDFMRWDIGPECGIPV